MSSEVGLVPYPIQSSSVLFILGVWESGGLAGWLGWSLQFPPDRTLLRDCWFLWFLLSLLLLSSSSSTCTSSTRADASMLAPGILHTIFFHRFFPGVTPRSREVLDIRLPYVEDAELDTMIEKRAAELDRELSAERTHTHTHTGGTSGGRGNISVQFFEKKRRKTWYLRGAGDDEVCWESWTIKVTVAEPRTEGGEYPQLCHATTKRGRGGLRESCR
jgi:hypothetical protein